MRIKHQLELDALNKYAAAELVRRYDPAIRQAVQAGLRDARLRRSFDTLDICQSVLGSFFAGVALGQFDLDKPEDLVGLLVTMARNKLAMHARKKQVRRRDPRPLPGDALPDAGSSPSGQVVRKDLVEEVRKRLTEEERYLADQRVAGREWAEIAVDRGQNAEALRKQLTRAPDRVARDLGLDDSGSQRSANRSPLRPKGRAPGPQRGSAAHEVPGPDGVDRPQGRGELAAWC
jgi:RNA polymerase sigma-70 factor (ECF subfamily)